MLGGVVQRDKTRSLIPTLLVLSVVTGIVDAVSVLGLGRVFVANMTGNVVFLGFAAVGTPDFHIAPLLVALLAFMLGALISGRLLEMRSEAPLGLAWHILLEALLLIAAAAVAIGYDAETMTPTWKLYTIIILTGVAMGYRNAAVRRLKVADMTTTVLTLTLTGLAAESTLALGSNPNWHRRVASVAAIGGGAGLGALLFLQLGVVAALLVSAMLVLVASAICPHTISYKMADPDGSDGAVRR